MNIKSVGVPWFFNPICIVVKKYFFIILEGGGGQDTPRVGLTSARQERFPKNIDGYQTNYPNLYTP